MNKKVLIPLGLALVLLWVLGCLFYFVPWSAPFDLTLNATKFDQNGNEIGTTQIHIYGKRLIYPLQKDRVEIEVDPFDEWSSFGQVKNASSGKKGEITSAANTMKITFHAVEGDEIVPCILLFTESFDHFVLTILGSEGKTIYLASVGDDHTADKVMDHFLALNVNPLPNRQG